MFYGKFRQFPCEYLPKIVIINVPEHILIIQSSIFAIHYRAKLNLEFTL